MILDAHQRQLAVAEALVGAVVEVDVGLDEVAGGVQRRVHGEAVVLGRDLHAPAGEVLHGLVRPPMPELQLEGPAAAGEGQHLVAEADPEDRPLPHQLPHRLHRVGERLGVPGTVGQEDPVGLPEQGVGGAGAGGHHGHGAALPGQHLEDVALDAEIVGHDPVLRFDRGRAEAVGLGAGHLAGQVGPHHGAGGPGPGLELGRIFGVRGDDAAHRTPGPEMARERPGVDTRDPHHAGRVQVVRQAPLRPPGRRDRGRFPHCEAGDLRRP